MTEHQALACRCGSCGSLTRAAFPERVHVPAQDGPRLAAADLKHGPCLPAERLAEICRDLCGVAVCAAPLAGMTRRAAERWRRCAERVRDRIAAASGVKYRGKTGFRSGGRKQWLPGLSTPWLTFSRPSARRGRLPEGLRGCLVHDPGQPSCTIPGVRHALCNAQHLREPQALADIHGEGWARQAPPGAAVQQMHLWCLAKPLYCMAVLV